MVARRKIVAAIKLNKIQIGPGRSPVGRMAKPGGFTIDKFVRSSAVTQHVPSNEPLSTSRHGNFADVLRHLIAPLHGGAPSDNRVPTLAMLFARRVAHVRCVIVDEPI